jgi:predicted nucleic-acid-binding protein
VIGLDTNIILRLFDVTEAKQSAAVERLFGSTEADGAFLLNPIVLSEFAWTLQRTYKKPRGVVADHIERLLQSPECIVPFLDEAVDALRRYRHGSSSFADYFLAAINRSLGCGTTLTFDRDAAEDREFFSLLKA